MKFSQRIMALAAVVLASTAGAWAQSGGGAAAAPAPVKVGTLNVRNAIVSTAEGKLASAELQSQFAPRNNELDAMRKQIEDTQTRLSNCARACSDEEKARLQRQGELLSRSFQRRSDELQEELNAAQGDVVDRIGRKMLEVLDRYARENGYAMVIDTSGQNSPVIYASNTVDVTQDIIRLYDQANPVKPGAAPAAPQPKPQQPGQARPQQPPATKPPLQPPAMKPPQP
jgi:outer membrane protein